MAKFKIDISREWFESGELIIEAASEGEAREMANELISVDDDSIEWFRDSMEPGKTEIEIVTRVATNAKAKNR